ncbi:hypothetical protein BKA69DRAFT_1085256 [Paraphysoderma sedebokerense]|nr:hypothetical protein BKA69DRAFT_1085256 [Paraphysoderma sedebokerense]
MTQGSYDKCYYISIHCVLFTSGNVYVGDTITKGVLSMYGFIIFASYFPFSQT